MSELEKQVLKVLEEAVPLLSEGDQRELLGYGKGIILNPEVIKEVLSKKQSEDKDPASATA